MLILWQCHLQHVALQTVLQRLAAGSLMDPLERSLKETENKRQDFHENGFGVIQKAGSGSELSPLRFALPPPLLLVTKKRQFKDLKHALSKSTD